MADWHAPQGKFDIPDLPDYIPRRLKPWIFVFFVMIIQFSGGVYLAAATDMVGTTALMQEDILMAGYAQLVGMAIYFSVMFRLKFHFSNRFSLLTCCTALIIANVICATTTCVPLLVATCFFAEWFRIWATFTCNSTIQLWITPTRDMSVFFCYVFIIVDSVIQLSGIWTVYTAFLSQWEYMQWIMVGLLLLMMTIVFIFVKPFHGMPKIPLLGIDWIGALLWGGFMMCFTFVCVYGNFYDWWDADEIVWATVLGVVCFCLNIWRATFLHHPYVSLMALTNRSVVRATVVYLVFYIILATEHVFEHGYASAILGFDETNLIDLNWYVFAGIVAGSVFTYCTFALLKWRYKTMTAIAFFCAVIYVAYFYFTIDYGVEKEMLFIPLFARGASSVIITIVILTSIVQSGLPFQIFPQAITVNGFIGAVMGATLGPAILGEWLRHTVAKNLSLLSATVTDFNPAIDLRRIGDIYGMVSRHALVVSMKEIYGWLLIAGLISLIIILVSYSPLRPWAFMPKWSKIRRMLRHDVRMLEKTQTSIS
ncbi:MAG: hypothetical protein NC411_00075 [Bacteroides sp.]|nr:hypothetical protein [Bacteroides sp.]